MPASRPAAARIVLVGDNASLRAGMRALIGGHEGLEVVGEARGRAAALAGVSRSRPHVVVLDLDGAGDPGFACELCDAIGPASRLLAVTAAQDAALHYGLLRAGAMGILLKDQLVECLVAAIRELCAGRAWLDGAVMAEVLRRMARDEGGGCGPQRAPVDDSVLTPREREIARLVSQGLGNRGVAERLFLSEGTVRNHLTVIFRKLGRTDRCDLIAHWPESTPARRPRARPAAR